MLPVVRREMAAPPATPVFQYLDFSPGGRGSVGSAVSLRRLFRFNCQTARLARRSRADERNGMVAGQCGFFVKENIPSSIPADEQ